MRYVDKKVAPARFQSWLDLASEEWQPTYADLQNPQKHDVHESLLTEQGWTCCYCGQSIAFDNSHIEHFRPQETHKDLDLAYTNFLASCGRKFEATTPSHCGHAKENQFDEQQHLSPLDPTCEARFFYTLDGQICVSNPEDANAKYMAQLLKLDITFLRNRRGKAVQSVFDEEFLATVSNESLKKLIQDFRTPDSDGEFLNLGHVLARFAEQQLK
ncbi:uncharacterized protein (TIGR02646 family) [Variovorax boronicumulans]|uniref:Uncharacterized protein (TIGR02646 family) n=1 Tax=Variovorax boronicumulans TaxID=436515 RepID=A0AAW8DRB0_9BURK|nr:retron system putative HNH endonuclease [Variovorax boronicumulans]MDP9877130.1 uncharacterized protein (TIGR02646 family) [Variovorax boronicumulans]MDP9921993.1 uncharacterized protein (TIGR02646 family) [Variovorax boronicumulans]